MADLGLDYDTLAAANPGLVMVSVTPFGQDGPYAHYNCYTLNLHHVSGHTHAVLHRPLRRAGHASRCRPVATPANTTAA